jgi:hypothetical protein
MPLPKCGMMGVVRVVGNFADAGVVRKDDGRRYAFPPYSMDVQEDVDTWLRRAWRVVSAVLAAWSGEVRPAWEGVDGRFRGHDGFLVWVGCRCPGAVVAGKDGGLASLTHPTPDGLGCGVRRVWVR